VPDFRQTRVALLVQAANTLLTIDPLPLRRPVSRLRQRTREHTMQTIEIPREDWGRRLNEFTTIHEGWLVSLDIMGAELGVQPEIVNLPLLGVSADRVNHDGTIAVSVARSRSEHFTHIIENVTRIYLERTDDGADAALQVESADGTKALLRFRATALPETVDGIVALG
jgi:hypothetical protein